MSRVWHSPVQSVIQDHLSSYTDRTKLKERVFKELQMMCFLHMILSRNPEESYERTPVVDATECNDLGIVPTKPHSIIPLRGPRNNNCDHLLVCKYITHETHLYICYITNCLIEKVITVFSTMKYQ